MTRKSITEATLSKHMTLMLEEWRSSPADLVLVVATALRNANRGDMLQNFNWSPQQINDAQNKLSEVADWFEGLVDDDEDWE